MNRLDGTDRQIIRLLQNNARMTNKELAASVELAPSTCHARVQRLIESGVIRGFGADITPAALGIRLQSMVSVQLTGNPQKRLEAFLQHVRTLPEVVDIYQVAGRTDLLLHVAVRDVEHMRDFIMNALSSRPEALQVESALIYEHEGARMPDLL
jgi:DNA-binding Lrp family transcriptional regulator